MRVQNEKQKLKLHKTTDGNPAESENLCSGNSSQSASLPPWTPK